MYIQYAYCYSTSSKRGSLKCVQDSSKPSRFLADPNGVSSADFFLVLEVLIILLVVLPLLLAVSTAVSLLVAFSSSGMSTWFESRKSLIFSVRFLAHSCLEIFVFLSKKMKSEKEVLKKHEIVGHFQHSQYKS